MLKYFSLRTSIHGIKYMEDTKLYKIERIFWALLCVIGLCFCSNVILQLYREFQSDHISIHIDTINYGITQIPFPSVTFCPGTIIDWNKAIQAVDNLTRSKIIHKNNTSELLNILKEISKLRYSILSDLKIDLDNSTLVSLKDIDLADLLYNAMPNCEQLFFNCSWGYDKKDCCDIFKIQKTIFGFCYAFNSLTSTNHNKTNNENSNLFKAVNYGIRGGFAFSVKYDDILYPPDSEENDTALFIISPPDMYPSKARKVRLRRKYNINIKFMCAYASPEVIQLENSNDVNACKYENNTYNYKKCLDSCEQRNILRMCECNPTFLYSRNVNYRDCKIKDLHCLIAKKRQKINTSLFLQNSKDDNKQKKSCGCLVDCKYCYYYDQVTGFDQDEKAIYIDVHFDGPTGIRYRRNLVASNLDLLVQLGGIFGLFLGGSLITLIEIMYYCLDGTIYSIYQIFIKLKKRKE